MSLKSKIEAVIYASEEPVTLAQLVGLLAGEAQEELVTIAADQASLPLGEDDPETEASNERDVLEAGTHEAPEETAADNSRVDAGGEEHAEAPHSQPLAEDVAPEAESSEQETAVEAAAPENALADSAEAPVAEAAEADSEEEKRVQRETEKSVREHIRRAVDSLIREYAESDRGIEIREVASGYRMGTKPEYHDAVRGFVKSLKPPLKLTLPALETLAVVAYKQPVTAAEISEIRGVDSAGVLGGLMTRKLIATAGRKQVIGRPMLYKTTRDFLLRFGLKDVNELPSMEEFERMAGELAEQEDLPMESSDAIIENANARGDAEMLREANAAEESTAENASEEAAPEEAVLSEESIVSEGEVVSEGAAPVETGAVTEESDSPEETTTAEESDPEDSPAIS